MRRQREKGGMLENFISISLLHTSNKSMLANFVHIIIVVYFVFVVRIIEFID